MRMGSSSGIALALAICLSATPARADEWDGSPPFSAPEIPATDTSIGALPITVSRWNLADIASPESSPALIDLTPATLAQPAEEPADIYGPAQPLSPGGPLDASGHIPRDHAPYRGFFQQAGTIKTELAILFVYIGAQSIPKLFKKTAPFHFKDEGWFGKDTANIGMDKLTHAFNTYLIADILHARLHRNTEGSEGDAATAGILAAGVMALNEISDGIETDSGYSMQDIAMNLTGATLSVLRNTVPGLKDKFAFKIEIMPNDQIYSHVGKKHYAQQRFLFALKGAGFEGLKRSPLRFLDLQIGYYATDFLNSDRARGIEPKRHLFFGLGLNLGELLFGRSESRFGKAAYSVLDHVQLPYTSLRVDTHGDFGHW